MLGLTAGTKVVPPRRRRRGGADVVAATKRRQRRVGQRRAALRERLMHAPQVPLVLGVELQDLLAPRFGEFRAYQQRHDGALAVDHALHRAACHP